MSRADRALAAVIRYEQAAQDIKEMTRQIAFAILRCDITGLAMEIDFPGKDTQALWDGNKIKNHLYWAYHTTTGADSPYTSERRLVDHEQEEFLRDEDCPHCLEAWQLIRSRKDARKAFGAAKRAIRAIGKAAIRDGETK